MIDLEIVEFAVKQHVVIFPGTLTPTEVISPEQDPILSKWCPARRWAETVTSGR